MRCVPILLILVACSSEVPVGNPYDPATPSAQQARSQLLVQAEIPGADPALWARGRVDVLSEGEVLASETPESGRALFEVAAGRYSVLVVVPGYRDARREIAVGGGDHVELPPITMRPAPPVGIEGIARRQGARDHADIRVRTLPTAFSALTGPEGRFRLEAPAGTYDLIFSADGYATTTLTGVEVAGEDPTRLNPVELGGAAGRVHGQLAVPSDFSRAVLSEASIHLGPDCEAEAQSARPDGDGAFVFAAVGPGEHCLSVELDGFMGATRVLELGPGEVAGVGLIILQPAARSVLVEGEARTEGGAASIRVDVEGAAFSTLASEGRYRLELPPRVQGYTLRFSLAGHGPRSLETGALEPGARVETEPVVLSAEPGSVRGVVRLDEGFSAERLDAVVVRLLRGEEEVQVTAPERSGHFSLRALPAGSYLLTASLAGFESRSAEALVPPGGVAELGVLALRFDESPAFVRGVARLAGAESHGGTRVEVLGTPFTTFTVLDGSYELPAPPGRVAVRFSHAGYGTPPPQVLPEVRLGSTVDVPPVLLHGEPSTVRGVVSIAEFASPAALRQVSVSALVGDLAVASAAVDPEGRFLLNGLGAGELTIRADAPGFQANSRVLRLPAGADRDLGAFRLVHDSRGDAARPFEGRVVLQGAGPVAGIAMRLVFAGRDTPFDGGLTDRAGAFQIDASPEDRYRVEATRPGWSVRDGGRSFAWSEAAQAFRPEDAPDEPITIELVPAPVRGRLIVPVRVSPAWLPAAARHVSVRVDGPVSATRERVADGAEAIFVDLPAGTYTVRVHRVGFGELRSTVELSAEQRSLRLPEQAARLVRLAGTRIDLTGQHLAAADLRGVDLRGADLIGVVLTGLVGGVEALDLRGADLSYADLTGADLSGARLAGADLFGAELGGVNAEDADLAGARLFGARLRGARLGGARLREAVLTGADLGEARLVKAEDPVPVRPCADLGASVDLAGASLRQANLSGVVATGVDLSDVDLSASRMHGARLDSTCLAAADLTLIDFESAVLDRADLRGALLTNAILRLTSAAGAALDGATLLSAIVERADWSPPPGCEPHPFVGEDEDLWDAECSGDARWTDPRCCRTTAAGANLNGANIVGANLSEVDLREASVLDVAIGDALVRPVEQPADCEPELYAQCVEGCSWATRCIEGHAPNCRAAVDRCASRLDLDPELRAAYACVVDGVATFGGCGVSPLQSTRLEACLGPNRPVFPAREAYCDWARLVEGDCEAVHVPRACEVTQTRMAGARLSGASLAAVLMQHADLGGALLDDADLRGAGVVDTVLDGAELRGARLDSASLPAANLSGQVLEDTVFAGADLTETLLRGADLSGANFDQARLDAVDFSGSRTTREPFRANGTSLRQVRADGAQWRDADLGSSNLSGLVADDVDWRGASLDNITMSGGRISGDLREASLRGADLRDVDLFEIRATGITLEDARLERVEIDGFEGPRDPIHRGLPLGDGVWRDVRLRRSAFRCEGPGCGEVGALIVWGGLLRLERLDLDGERLRVSSKTLLLVDPSVADGFLHLEQLDGGEGLRIEGGDFRRGQLFLTRGRRTSITPGASGPANFDAGRLSFRDLDVDLIEVSAVAAGMDAGTSSGGMQVAFRSSDLRGASLGLRASREFLADYRLDIQDSALHGAWIRTDRFSCLRCTLVETHLRHEIDLHGTNFLDLREEDAPPHFSRSTLRRVFFGALRGLRVEESCVDTPLLVPSETEQLRQGACVPGRGPTDCPSERPWPGCAPCRFQANYVAPPPPALMADLRDASFTDTRLRHEAIGSGHAANLGFRQVDLSAARFTRSDLREVDFSWSRLEGSTFHDTLVAGARFENADLSDADLRCLCDADQAAWAGADLEGARVDQAAWARGDFAGAVGQPRFAECDSRLLCARRLCEGE